MASIEEVQEWLVAKLFADATLASYLAAITYADGAGAAIYEAYPASGAEHPCVDWATLGELPAEEQDADGDKNVLWRLQLSARSLTTSSYWGPTRNAAIYNRIDALLYDLPQRETCTTDNFRILHIRRGPMRDLTEDGRLHQKVADWAVKAIRNS